MLSNHIIKQTPTLAYQPVPDYAYRSIWQIEVPTLTWQQYVFVTCNNFLNPLEHLSKYR
jgi:hypothetical protein